MSGKPKRRMIPVPDPRRPPRARGRLLWAFIVLWLLVPGHGSAPEAAPPNPSWKVYHNARFGFTISYPETWRLGEALPDGLGILLSPPVPKSHVALSGFLNTVEGSSPEGRQTLEEFAVAHRRIFSEYYAKKNIAVQWQLDHRTTLGGKPAKELQFSYRNGEDTAIVEIHLFSLGRNEGRGVRVKLPAADQAALLPVIRRMLDTYQPGRDQDAVSPLVPRQP